MKIVLASTSSLKLQAVQQAFGPDVKVVTVSVPSGVNEQPFGDETLRGARNRIAGARVAHPEADCYVSIESGIFEIISPDGRTEYIDRAVIVMENTAEAEWVRYSEGVTFPRGCVEEAQRRGFDAWTVGEVMAELGIVKNHADPHLDLVGRSRVSFLVVELAQFVESMRPCY